MKSLAKDDEISLYTIGIMSMTDTTARFGKTEKQWNQNHVGIQWNMPQRSKQIKFVTTIIITKMMIVIKEHYSMTLGAIKTRRKVYEYSHTYY